MVNYFYVFGNPKSNKIFLFEKPHIFYKFINKQFIESMKFYSICSIGLPSKSCLEHLKRFRNKQIFYFGDLDSESLWCYLTFVFGNRNLEKKSKIKFNIKFAGLTVKDYKKFISKENVLIKMKPIEKRILKSINEINPKELIEEIKFLNKGYKVEMEAISKISFDKYFEFKTNQEIKL